MLFYHSILLPRPKNPIPISADILHTVIILSQKSFCGVDHSHQISIRRVQNCAVQPGIHRKNRKAQIHHLPHRKIERNIADSSSDMNIRAAPADRLDHFCIHSNPIFRSAQHFHQRINVEPEDINFVFLCLSQNIVKYFQTVCSGLWYAGIVREQTDNLPFRIRDGRKDAINLIAFSRYRIN